MNQWLRENLVCPRDKQKLETVENNLICPANHSYPVVEGIPVMLVEEQEHIHGYITETLATVAEIRAANAAQIDETAATGGAVDSYVQSEILYTCGNLYLPLMNRLTRYPIPELRLPAGDGKRLLDVGCNWGRWTVAAAQNGYRPVGIDPSLKAVLAARRVCKQLNVTADFVVGDARYLPFASGSFDIGFSYSVLQHFSKDNARISLEEIARVVKREGKAVVQMANKFGLRSFYQQWRQGFGEGKGTDVRYWSPAELIETFKEKFGATEISVDCFFGLNIQKNDMDLLPARFKLVVRSSEALRRLSRKLPFLVNAADSVYLESNVNKW